MSHPHRIYVIAENLAGAAELFARCALRHPLLAGGATVAAVLHALPVSVLRVTGEGSPGGVALATDQLAVTLKPGSYSWPETLTAVLRG